MGRGPTQQFPDRYVQATSVNQLATHLFAIHTLSVEPIHVQASYNKDLGVSEYVLITREQAKPGLFMQVTGVLAALGLEVLDAQIMTLANGTVVDAFSVNDRDGEGEPPASRFKEVLREIQLVVEEKQSVQQLFEQRRRMTFRRQFPTGRHSTEVHIDHETSDAFTVIEVFADDKPGLLFVIAKSLVRLELSIHMARIGTRLDQVADVFYVTCAQGGKVLPGETCEHIQNALRTAVDLFLDGKDNAFS